MEESAAQKYRIEQLNTMNKDLSSKGAENDAQIKRRLPTFKYEFPAISTTSSVVDYEIALERILVAIKKNIQPDTVLPKDVKIAVIGDDNTLHLTVSAYTSLRLTHDDLFDKIDLKFYILPFGESDITQTVTPRNLFAQFLADFDPWYKGHVFEMLNNLTKVIPSISPKSTVAIKKIMKKDDKNMLDETTIDCITPGRLMKFELESYFREASCDLQVNVFQCECFTPSGTSLFKANNNSSPGVDSTILYFYQRVELGLNVAVQTFKEQKGVTSMNSSQIQKQVKFVGTEVSIKMTLMNVAGATRPGPTFDSRPFQHIVIGSIPVQGDKFTRPHPSSPWLELFTLEAEALRKKKSKLDEGHSYHISMIEVEADKKKPFDILVDGNVIGPFYKMRITPCTKNNVGPQANSNPTLNEIVNFPVMTFFPLDL